MSKMGQEFLRITEIAAHGTDEQKIKQFGSVEAAAIWLDKLEREQELADRDDPEIARVLMGWK